MRGGSEEAREETEALDAGRPCTRAGVDVSLGAGEVDGSWGVGTGDGVVGCPKRLFVANGLFELRNRTVSVITRDGTGQDGAYPNAVFCGMSGACWEACSVA